MTPSSKKFESEQKHEGAPFKPAFGLGGVVDLDVDVVCHEWRVAHICPLLANVGNINVSSWGFACV
jgi:hypothetical protein